MLKKLNFKFFFRSLFLLISINSSIHAIQFLTLSDIHYGTQHSCKDTDDILWNTTMKKAQELTTSTEFIIFLGDIPEHHANKDEKSNIEAKIFHDLYALASNKPIFYVPGNNDSLLGNYAPFSRNGSSPLENAPEWDGGACANCSHLLINNTFMAEHGYYSSYVLPNNNDIALIVLNATQFTNIPWWLNAYPHQDKDAQAQLNWLSQQLQQLKTKQLLIAMHEEPGLDYVNKQVWKKKYLLQFINLLNNAEQNHQEITLLTAHSHYDEIRKVTLMSGKSIFSYSTPSISRIHQNNSGLKLFSLNNALAINNFTTYYTPSNTDWKNQHYVAKEFKNSIFTKCQSGDLSTCLNSFDAKEICNQLETQLIYGVKNADVSIKNCLQMYSIN